MHSNPPQPDHQLPRPQGTVAPKEVVPSNAQLAALDISMHQAEIAFALRRANPPAHFFCEESLVVLGCAQGGLLPGFSVSESAQELARHVKLVRLIAKKL